MVFSKDLCRHIKTRAGLFGKGLGQVKLKAFADNTKKCSQIKLKVVLGRVENMVGKGENAGCQDSLLFPQYFQKASFLRVVKSWDCVVEFSETVSIS